MHEPLDELIDIGKQVTEAFATMVPEDERELVMRCGPKAVSGILASVVKRWHRSMPVAQMAEVAWTIVRALATGQMTRLVPGAVDTDRVEAVLQAVYASGHTHPILRRSDLMQVMAADYAAMHPTLSPEGVAQKIVVVLQQSIEEVMAAATAGQHVH